MSDAQSLPLPPGEDGLPLLGQTLAFLKDPFGFVEDRVGRYGPVFRTRLLGRRTAVVTGPDAAAFTQLLTPRDLSKCRVGEGRYVVITADDGGIVNDPVLLRLGKNHFWLSLANSDVLLYALGVAIHADMDVDICEPDVSPMQVQGPKSKHVLRALFGDRVLDMPYYSFFEANLDGIPVVVTRTGWTAEVGYEVYLRDGSKGEALWEKVMAAGKAHNIRPIAPSEIRRIEAGILNYGSDITLENNPYEVGLGWLVDLDMKADFIGKKPLKEIKKDGVTRKLVGLEIHGPKIGSWLEEYWPVRADGMAAGRLTALTYSPRLEKNIGYALVPTKSAKLGTQLRIDTPSGERRATVVRKPFVDPKKEIPKA